MVAPRESLGRRIFRDTASVSFVNAVGQVAVFVMAAYVAATFGADWHTDALGLALAVPMFTSTVVREAVKSVLVPLLVEFRVKGDDRLSRVATTSVLWVGVGTTLLALALAVATPLVVGLLGSQLPPEGRSLMTTLSYILLVMLPFLCLSGTMSALLSTYGQFWQTATLPGLDALVKIGIVAALAAQIGIYSQAWGNVGGALVGALLLSMAAHRFGYLARPTIRRPGNLAEALRIGSKALYPLLGLTFLQLNPYVDRFMASRLQAGSVTALNYADRIAAIPYLLVGVGFYNVLLAHWSEVAAEQGQDALRQALRNATAMVVFLLAPVVTIMFILRIDLVTLLLQRGAFDASDTTLTAAALGFSALAVLPNYLALLVTRAFLALQDQRIPMWLGLINAFLNLGLNLLLIGPFGLAGVTLSTALTWVVVTLVGWWLLRRRLGALGVLSLVRPLVIMGLASLACGLVAWGVMRVIPSAGLMMLVIRLAVAGGLGILVYAGLTWLFRIEEVAKLQFLVQRSLRRPKA